MTLLLCTMSLHSQDRLHIWLLSKLLCLLSWNSQPFFQFQKSQIIFCLPLILKIICFILFLKPYLGHMHWECPNTYEWISFQLLFFGPSHSSVDLLLIQKWQEHQAGPSWATFLHFLPSVNLLFPHIPQLLIKSIFLSHCCWSPLRVFQMMLLRLQYWGLHFYFCQIFLGKKFRPIGQVSDWHLWEQVNPQFHNIPGLDLTQHSLDQLWTFHCEKLASTPHLLQ